jgi:hypothetical protein
MMSDNSYNFGSYLPSNNQNIPTKSNYEIDELNQSSFFEPSSKPLKKSLNFNFFETSMYNLPYQKKSKEDEQSKIEEFLKTKTTLKTTKNFPKFYNEKSDLFNPFSCISFISNGSKEEIESQEEINSSNSLPCIKDYEIGMSYIPSSSTCKRNIGSNMFFKTKIDTRESNIEDESTVLDFSKISIKSSVNQESFYQSSIHYVPTENNIKMPATPVDKSNKDSNHFTFEFQKFINQTNQENQKNENLQRKRKRDDSSTGSDSENSFKDPKNPNQSKGNTTKKERTSKRRSKELAVEELTMPKAVFISQEDFMLKNFQKRFNQNLCLQSGSLESTKKYTPENYIPPDKLQTLSHISNLPDKLLKNTRMKKIWKPDEKAVEPLSKLKIFKY